MANNGLTHPIPEGFINYLKELLPSDNEADMLCEALNSDSPVAIRFNTRKPLPVTFPNQKPVAWCNEGVYLDERPIFTLNPHFHAGIFYVQEPASMFHSHMTKIAVNLLGEKPFRVLDLCAAPGGKTTAVMNELPAGSVVIANEFSPQRASVLRENIIKYGNPDVCITNADARKFASAPAIADLVIVDAPCSGEGMMRKEETARTQWSENLVKSCAALQKEILEAAVEALAPGGIIIYSTCTFNTLENEENVEYLIDTHHLEPIPIDLKNFPELRHGLSDNTEVRECSVRFFPHLGNTEGLFVSMLKKPEDSLTDNYLPSVKQSKRKGNHKTTQNNVPPSLFKQISGWINQDAHLELIAENFNIRAISQKLREMITKLPSDVKVLTSGLEIGTVKGKDIVPAHQLALSSALNRNSFPIVNLSEQEAVRYLQRENIILPENTGKGFVIVAYCDIPLGFVKNIGNRCNNLYPAEYKIRMKI